MAVVKDNVAQFLRRCASCRLVSRAAHQESMNRGAAQIRALWRRRAVQTLLPSVSRRIVIGVSHGRHTREEERGRRVRKVVGEELISIGGPIDSRNIRKEKKRKISPPSFNIQNFQDLQKLLSHHPNKN